MMCNVRREGATPTEIKAFRENYKLEEVSYSRRKSVMRSAQRGGPSLMIQFTKTT